MLPKRNGLDTSLVRAAKPYGPFVMQSFMPNTFALRRGSKS